MVYQRRHNGVSTAAILLLTFTLPGLFIFGGVMVFSISSQPGFNASRNIANAFFATGLAGFVLGFGFIFFRFAFR